MNEDVEFPGFITRQSLVDFCRSQQVETEKSRQEIEKALGVTNLDQETRTELEDLYATSLGRQLSLRNVCEWAKSHSVPDINQGARKYATRGG